MILPALIVIIIVLIYANVYFYYSKDKPYKSYTKKCMSTPMMQSADVKMSMPMPMAMSKPMADHDASAYPNYENAQYAQEQSRRDRSDSYAGNPEMLSVNEYMTNKYATSYMQNIATVPSATNYNEYMISTGLESGVVDSHKEFTDETQNKTTGASSETVFSHDDAIVPSWGLRRRSAQIPINPNSREVPSQTNEQLADNSQEFKYGLF